VVALLAMNSVMRTGPTPLAATVGEVCPTMVLNTSRRATMSKNGRRVGFRFIEMGMLD
jgi:hypothetical protein